MNCSVVDVFRFNGWVCDEPHDEELPHGTVHVSFYSQWTYSEICSTMYAGLTKPLNMTLVFGYDKIVVVY